MSQGGDWDKWTDWVPGDPVPGELPPDSPSRRASAPDPHAHVPDTTPPQAAAAPGGSRVVALAVVALLVLGGGAFAVLAGVAVESEPGTDGVITEVSFGGPAPMTPAASGLDLLRDGLDPALDLLEARLGAAPRFEELVIYPTYVLVTVETPQRPGELDRYTVAPPARVSGPHSWGSPGDLEPVVFERSSTDLDLLARLPARAEAELAMPGGVADYAIIRRGSLGVDDVSITVYVRSDRQTGYVQFSAGGEVLRAYAGG